MFPNLILLHLQSLGEELLNNQLAEGDNKLYFGEFT
jgi:hypothetical protein